MEVMVKECAQPVLCGVLLPVLYHVLIQRYQNVRRRRVLWETGILLLGEGAMVKMWLSHAEGNLPAIRFYLFFLSLVFMSVFCMTDLLEKAVPNRLLLLMAAGGIGILLFFAISDRAIVTGLLPSMLAGALICCIIFGAAYLVSKGRLGGGDVKLVVLLGFFLTGEVTIPAVFLGVVFCAIVYAIQIWRKKITRDEEIPLVPFLYIGLVAACFCG